MPIYKVNTQFLLLYIPISLTLPKGNTTSYNNSSAFLPPCCPPFHILNSTLHCLPLEDEISHVLAENSNPYSVRDTCNGGFEVVDLVKTMNFSESDQPVHQADLCE